MTNIRRLQEIESEISNLSDVSEMVHGYAQIISDGINGGKDVTNDVNESFDLFKSSICETIYLCREKIRIKIDMLPCGLEQNYLLKFFDNYVLNCKFLDSVMEPLWKIRCNNAYLLGKEDGAEEERRRQES